MDVARRTPSVLSDDDREFLSERLGDRALFDAPLAPYTSWKIGGPADALVSIESSDELADVLRRSFKRHIPRFVLGSGSNILIGDGGIRGIVIRLGGEFAAIEVVSEGVAVVVRAGASASLALLTAQAATKGAAGIGSLAGIPGSVGGALRMNAGTDKEMGDFVRDVWVQTPTKPDAHPVSVQYYYRHTSIGRDAIVARVTLAFPREDPAEVRADMNARLRRRKDTQPLQFPNAGSCFRNPPGDRAGRLIEAAGAKGWRAGGAEVSALHANFIVNVDSATALDVATLLARVRRAVFEQFGVELQPEVHMVGEFVA
ncbi:MAG TPA: UDP-N-acetylmuramate dehydrogenase [Candidatus Acidoferrales bacterium]|nr:UDP-N-acetylmuramate dehydrogenase [Candidatus Acidoferrales bacterium]